MSGRRGSGSGPRGALPCGAGRWPTLRGRRRPSPPRGTCSGRAGGTGSAGQRQSRPPVREAATATAVAGWLVTTGRGTHPTGRGWTSPHRDEVRAGKVVNYACPVGDAQVADKRQQPPRRRARTVRRLSLYASCAVRCSHRHAHGGGRTHVREQRDGRPDEARRVALARDEVRRDLGHVRRRAQARLGPVQLDLQRARVVRHGRANAFHRLGLAGTNGCSLSGVAQGPS